MAYDWLNRAEKKVRRDAERNCDLSIDLMSTLSTDARAENVVKRLGRSGIDFTSHDLRDSSEITPHYLRVTVETLLQSAQSVADIARSISARCDVSALTAKRNAYRAVSLLKSCGRATTRNNLVELK